MRAMKYLALAVLALLMSGCRETIHEAQAQSNHQEVALISSSSAKM
jgi:hypothetical protein